MTSTSAAVNAPEAVNVKIGEYVLELESLLTTLKERVNDASLTSEELAHAADQAADYLRNSSSFLDRIATRVDFAQVAEKLTTDYSGTIQCYVKNRLNRITQDSLTDTINNIVSASLINHLALIEDHYVAKVYNKALRNIKTREAAFATLMDTPSLSQQEEWISLRSGTICGLTKILRCFADPESHQIPLNNCFNLENSCAIINADEIIITIGSPGHECQVRKSAATYYPAREAAELCLDVVTHDLIKAYRNSWGSKLLPSETWLDRFYYITSPAFRTSTVEKARNYLAAHPEFSSGTLESAYQELRDMP